MGYRAYETRCLECHTYKGTGGGNMQGPDFTGYGDAEWIRLMVMSPNHQLRYGWRNRNAMPAFRDLEGPAGEVNRQDMDELRRLLLRQVMADDPQAEVKKQQVEDATHVVHLSDIDRELIIRWLTGAYRVVFGGAAVSGPEPAKR
jgi:mono/diheme cytochrome c family protein